MTRPTGTTLALCAALTFTLVPAFGRGSGSPPSPAEDGTMPALTAIAGEGMMDSHAYDNLEELSDTIGGRVTGSPECNRAIEWGLAKMKAIGLQNVHAEHWQLSRGWARVSANAEVIAPIHHKLMVDSLGWVGSTPEGGAEADVVPVNLYQLDDEMKNSSMWAGKVLLIVQKGEAPKDRASLFARFGPFLKAAYAAHAVAVIGGQGGGKAAGMHLTHTGVLGFDTYYDIPVVSMAAEDQDQIERFLDHGKTVRLKIDVQNRTTDGPVDSANVVGDIRGTEHPEQIVVVGGHLDSWDLAEGSTDNGVGTVTTLGAAQAIAASGFKPKRTLRFVLFTGEEQGLLGSLAYAKAHKDEMANHVAAVILDNGPGAVTSLNLGGRSDLIPAVERFADSVKAFGELKVNDNTAFGTDTGPFILAGLPGINMGQDSPEYKYTHHSIVDTFDHVQPDLLTRDATLMALTAFWIADRPERLATPWPAEKTAKMLVEKKQDGFLKAFGLWPFGNLGTEPKTAGAAEKKVGK
ncbi:MAG TPA: M20/M25/M40 family metallo-hydrolase [Terriglobia bacterium]|nr:M20/M25/M40 family metallo-hydrolase [Terriglobia bacterium]